MTVCIVYLCCNLEGACAGEEVQTLILVCDIVMMYLWVGGEGENSEIEGCEHDGVS